MKRGLSPYPSLLLALEGKTELLLMTKVLDELFGEPVPPTLIECVFMDTIDRDLDMIVRHSISLRPGEPRGTFVMLDRPPTKILVAVDPEKKYASRPLAEKERKKLVRRIWGVLPPEYRSRVTAADLDSLVTVRTWGTKPWEFANFTDTELAKAVASVVALPSGITWRDVRLRVAALRTKKNPDIEVVARCWGLDVKKVPLAQALEEVLLAKVRVREANGTLARLPASRVAAEAIELALTTHRRSVALPLS